MTLPPRSGVRAGHASPPQQPRQSAPQQRRGPARYATIPTTPGPGPASSGVTFRARGFRPGILDMGIGGIASGGLINDDLGDGTRKLSAPIIPPILRGLLMLRDNYVTTRPSDQVADKRRFRIVQVPTVDAKLPGPHQRTSTPESQNGGHGQLQPLVRSVSFAAQAFRLTRPDACGCPRR